MTQNENYNMADMGDRHMRGLKKTLPKKFL